MTRSPLGPLSPSSAKSSESEKGEPGGGVEILGLENGFRKGLAGKLGSMKTAGEELRMAGRVPMDGVTEEFEVRGE